LLGDISAINALFSIGDVYYDKTDVPVSFTSEGVWTQLDLQESTNPPPKGRWAVDIYAVWSVNTITERTSLLRLLINGEPGDEYSVTSDSAADQNSITAFRELYFDGVSPLTFELQGQVGVGGGAATFELTRYRIRFRLIEAEAEEPAL
jgi:hypothetical protein